ncbi:MAG: hypothetical protein ACRDBP_15520, partial [Luteolibacter sp.]
MIMHPKKLASSLVALAIAQAAVPAQAAVSMLSVTHRVWGDAGTFATKAIYDQTAAVPVTQSITGRTSPPSFGSFLNQASSSAGAWSVSAYRNGDADYANAHAQNTYLFQPLYQNLSISLGGVIGAWWFENKAQMTLTDLTTNLVVSSYRSPAYTRISPFADFFDMRDAPVSWTAAVAVDPGHQYELVLYSSAHRGEGGSGSASLNLTLVPEPSAPLLA